MTIKLESPLYPRKRWIKMYTTGEVGTLRKSQVLGQGKFTSGSTLVDCSGLSGRAWMVWTMKSLAIKWKEDKKGVAILLMAIAIVAELAVDEYLFYFGW